LAATTLLRHWSGAEWGGVHRWDTALDRTLALKFLGPERVEDPAGPTSLFVGPRALAELGALNEVGSGYPTSTMHRALEDLAAHGVVARNKQSGAADYWQVTDYAKSLYDSSMARKP
jgi:hypothetical protein